MTLLSFVIDFNQADPLDFFNFDNLFINLLYKIDMDPLPSFS